MKVELESQEAAILCYSKPAAIEGKIKDNYTNQGVFQEIMKKKCCFFGKIKAKKNSF